MEAVVTYLNNTPTPQLPAIQVSTLPPKMKTGQDLLEKVVEEFIGCWGVQREAYIDDLNILEIILLSSLLEDYNYLEHVPNDIGVYN